MSSDSHRNTKWLSQPYLLGVEMVYEYTTKCLILDKISNSKEYTIRESIVKFENSHPFLMRYILQYFSRNRVDFCGDFKMSDMMNTGIDFMKVIDKMPNDARKDYISEEEFIVKSCLRGDCTVDDLIAYHDMISDLLGIADFSRISVESEYQEEDGINIGIFFNSLVCIVYSLIDKWSTFNGKNK